MNRVPTVTVGKALDPGLSGSIGWAHCRVFPRENMTMPDRQATVAGNLPVLDDLSVQDILSLDRSVLSESLLRVREYLSAEDTEHVSRFTAAL